MILSLVVALTRGRQVIGKDNKLPWHLPEDLKHFREVTAGHTVIMGRKTHESIGRPLPKRRNIVISRQSALVVSGCEVLHSLPEALKTCANEEEVFVIGGAALFQEALAIADRLYLTWIEQNFDGDVFFPPLRLEDFKEVARQDFLEPFRYSFVNYQRI